MTERRWTKLSSKLVYRNGGFFSVYEDLALAPDGKEYKYGIIKSKAAVFVVARTTDEKYLLVEQYRYAVEKNMIELVAGGIEDGDDPVETARHELMEEANATAESIECLGEVLASPVRQHLELHVILATGINISALKSINQDGNEAINRVWAVTESELLGLIGSGELNDAASLAALNLYWVKRGFPR